MDQGDVLSYLVLGRPLNQASSSEGASLYKAAAALGAAGGNKLTSFLAQKFGLQELSVETGATPQEASLVLGTYLAPKVYVRYVQDLANQTATIRIRYELSRRWTLETESSATGAGVDILFNIER
jgi:translocation and assembly module TamB